MGETLLLLGVDSSGPQALLVLAEGEEIIAERHLSVERTHMEKLLPSLERMLTQTGLHVQQAEAVAVGLGPGSFTGTRLGVVIAKTLSQALEIPLVGVPSLDIIAAGSDEGELVCALTDARRNEVYSATYRRSEEGVERLDEYRATQPEALARDLDELGVVVTFVGDGLRTYASILRDKLGVRFRPVRAELWPPQPSALVQLALARLSEGKSDDLFQLVPIYVRKPDIRVPDGRFS